MTESAKDADVVELLTRYSFDLSGHSVERLTGYWLSRYPQSWVRLAVIEALYQGRYKAISVEQILNLWRRRGKPLHHFNSEFERIICSRFPKTLRSFVPPKRPKQTHGTDASPAAQAGAGSRQPEPQPPAPKPEAAMGAAASTEPAPPFPPAAETLEVTDTLSAEREPGSLSEAEVEQLLSWSRMNAGKYPIHQFVPTPEASDFYSKLKAVAHDTIVRHSRAPQNPPPIAPNPSDEEASSKSNSILR